MARFSLHKPGVFSKLWRSVKPAATRFPALFVLGIVAAVALSLIFSFNFFYGSDELTERIAWAGVWGMLLSVLAQLILERQQIVAATAKEIAEIEREQLNGQEDA